MLHLSVAVFCTLDMPFTYLWPAELGDAPKPGCRVKVPFGKRSLIGLVLGEALAPANPAKTKAVEALIDAQPLWDEASWKTWLWMADYYHHPIGDALATTLPAGLAKGETPEPAEGNLPDMSGEVSYIANPDLPPLAGKQKVVIKLAQSNPHGLSRTELVEQSDTPRTVDMLIRSGALIPVRRTTAATMVLTQEQQDAAQSIKDALGSFGVLLLDGVTGSGKTEVFMEAMSAAIAAGKQVLYLVPEIGLTPQTCARLEKRFEVCVLHSKLSEKDRGLAWSLARSGQAKVIVGTRSALFTPIADLGLIIIDEEHDHSFKQDTRLRYHARDVAIFLANKRNIPIVLGSATPSAETMRSALSGRYKHLRMTARANGCAMPKIEVLDAKSMPQQDGLTPVAMGLIKRTLEAGEQAMVFLPRRGFAHTMFCRSCGWASECPNCDARMVFHKGKGKMICHHCGESNRQPGACPKCSEEIVPLGAGTERAEELLIGSFGAENVIRLDTDVISTPANMHAAFAHIRSGRPLCIVGTQMLAKGHDFPNVTMVVITGSDAALFSADARAAERFIQQVTQVAGRSGRAKPGRVIIQTSQADHPILQQLVREGYHKTIEGIIHGYEQAMLAPVSATALITVETNDRNTGSDYLESVINEINHPALVGPFPAIMERKAGAYRYQAVVLAETRKERHELLCKLKAAWKRKTTRFPLYIDVDPCQSG
jgi:primosomal protein N' (replication factor Y)